MEELQQSDIDNVNEAIRNMTTPKEETKVETASSQDAKSDPLNTPEVNKAAKDFGNLVPQIRAFAKNMKAGGLARVMIAAAEFPLGNEYPKFKVKEEQELFMMLLHVEALKNTMKTALMASEGALAEIQEQAINEVVEETLTKIQKEN